MTCQQAASLLVAQFAAQDLAHGGLGQLGAELNHLGMLVTREVDAAKIAQLAQFGVKVRCFNGDKLALTQVMAALVEDGITEVHVEAGATLTGALVAQGFADEMVIYLAAHLMGSRARALFDLPHLAHMHERIKLEIRDIRAVGQDWRMIINPKPEVKN